MDLFVRASDDKEYFRYKSYIAKYLNDNNLLSVRSKQIKQLFQIGVEQHFLRYRFELLNRWIKWNLKYTSASIKTLDSIISKLNILENLNHLETNFIYSIRNVVFAKKRNLKSVINDLPLDKNEYVYYVYKIDGCDVGNKLFDATAIFFTNKRTIFKKTSKDFLFFDYTQLSDYHLYSNNLKFNADNKTYTVYCTDPKLLYVSLERILRLVKINKTKHE